MRNRRCWNRNGGRVLTLDITLFGVVAEREVTLLL
jgi:hypothetical protein